MNWDEISGNWKQFHGATRAGRGKLTDDDLKMIEGDFGRLAGRIQERYGIAKEEARKRAENRNP